ncbi:MAG TPA: hypothetical protein VK420_09525 [Longimicrobium sp.]|jgi:hypothetical protein|nr:hypothetical protein [Longimicrobium sp.]
MLRPSLVLLLALTSIHPAHAQEHFRGGPAPSTTVSDGPAGLRLVLDSRLVPPARAESPLASRAAERAGAHALTPASHWKAGAAIGAVLGALAGFGFGYTMENIINEGEWSVGGATIGATAVGAVGGGLIGAGVGSRMRR